MPDRTDAAPVPVFQGNDDGTFEGLPWRIDGKVAEHADLSGIACRADGYGLLATDEGSLMQPFQLDAGTRTLRMTQPGIGLLRPGEEADLEGLCCDGERFYAVGSHASGRKVPDHQPSRHHLYCLWHEAGTLRFDISHALEPLLENDALLRRHYRRRLNGAERGLDIEGIAAVPGDRLLIGLRSPTLDGQAFLLSVSVEAVFGLKGSRQQTAERYALPIGAGAGIRDLAAIPEGVLILAGPSTDDDEAPFTLWYWSGRRKLRQLGTFVQADGAKAEGLLVLETANEHLHILVVFDGVERGGIHEFRVPRPG